VVNKGGTGKIDTSQGKISLIGKVGAIKIRQNSISSFWVCYQGTSASDSADYIYRYSAWLIIKSGKRIGGNLVSLDLDLLRNQVWVADKARNSVLRVSQATDTTIATVVGFLHPSMVAVNTKDSTCWIVDTDNNQVIRLNWNVPNGYDIRSGTDHLKIIDAFGIPFKQPVALAVNPNEGNGVVWVVDTQNNRIVKLDSRGERLLSISEFGMESSAFIAANTGTK
jgi:DNA-binding beta-propeller fold protein YncE